ncbi:MAG TPA: hypothetical protein VNO31_02440, partial [Umezawaea sp.]|nr:hypothetical protein [Umezawaea sp.]
VTPPEVRSTAFALVGFCLAFVGGLGGGLATGVVEALWDDRAAIAVVAPIASVAAGLVLAGGARHLPHDLAKAAADARGRGLR